MMVLNLEQRGAYNTLLDLIYSKNGQVADDSEFVCGWLRCDIRVWRRLKKELIDLEKIYIEDGFIRNKVADIVIDRALLRVSSRPNRSTQVQPKLTPKSDGEDNENNDIPKKRGSKTAGESRIQTLDIDSNESITPYPLGEKSPPAPAVSVVEIDMEFQKLWNIFPGFGKNGIRGAGFKGTRKTASEKFSTIYRSTKENEREALIRFIAVSIEHYRKHLELTDGISCHFVTWLNQRRWETDYSLTESDRPAKRSGHSLHDVHDQVLADRSTVGPEGRSERLASFGIEFDPGEGS